MKDGGPGRKAKPGRRTRSLTDERPPAARDHPENRPHPSSFSGSRLRALVRHQEAIAELSRRVLQGMDADGLLAECVALVARTLETDACVVLESLPKDGRFIVRAASGLREGAERLTVSDSSRSLAGQALWAGSPLVVGPLPSGRHRIAPEAAALEEEEVFGLRVRGGLVVTVSGQDDRPPFGVLAAYSTRARKFTRDDVFFVQFIANTAAAALERHRQETALRLGEARYQRIAAHTPGMVYQFRLQPDGAFSFPFVTEGCRELFSVDPQQIYENPLMVIDILHETDRGTLFPAILASAQSMTAFRWTGRYVTRAGETRWMRADSRPELQPNGDVIWDGIMFDISELKRAQEATVAAKDEAEKANRAKSEFLSRISHELRTPLNAILGFSQFLQRQQPAGDATEHDCLGHIAKAGMHLLGLINEVLDISRIEAGHVELAPVPIAVGAAVGEAFALVRGQADERGISLRLEQPANARRLRVLADPQRLKQILLNLLSNAVKYNSNGGGVRVSCTRVERTPGEGNFLEIAVADDGPGIPAGKLGRLFVAFDRLGAENSSVPGTGLGLVLSKCLVEALGGSVTVESEPGRGTTFRVRLPAGAPESARRTRVRPTPRQDGGTPALPPGPAFRRPHRVLYIEDNPSNLALVALLLEGHPQITLLKATCANDGLRILHRQPPPDLLLLDLHLPDLPGEEVLTRLRQGPDGPGRRLPVVVMSADATAASVERLLALGADAYLTKPLDLPTLLVTLQKHLEAAGKTVRRRASD